MNYLLNIFNKHFSSVGEKFASKMPSSSKHFSQYLNNSNYPNSFFFTPITSSEVEFEIFHIVKQLGSTPVIHAY